MSEINPGWYVLETPWHSLIVHKLAIDTPLEGYKIKAGPFDDIQIAGPPPMTISGDFQAYKAMSQLMSVDDETARKNATPSPPHKSDPIWEK